ncbi:MAG: metal ABC transporter solute-binding protein, Zn/Mn family, partial [Phycisphaerales bacterium]
VTAAVAALALLACDRPLAGVAGGGSARLKVVCTIGMIADVAARIGGERVEVKGLMGEGVDPHLYKASPGDVRMLTEAGLVLYCGLHLEGRMADTLVKLAGKTPTIRVTDSIPENRLREPEEMEGHYDPHLWFDVSLWSMVAERIRDGLIERDPAGAGAYRSACAAYQQELMELHGWCATELAKVPPERRVLVTAHDAFGYFGRAYGVEVMAIQGVSTDSEAGLKAINDLVDTLVRRKIPAVFVESSVPEKTVRSLVEACGSRGHAVRIGGELFSDAMGREGTPEGTYIGMVRHNVRTIVGALGEQGAAK